MPDEPLPDTTIPTEPVATSEGTPPDLYAEFNQRMGELQNRLTTLSNYVAGLQPQRGEPASPVTTAPSDEDLWGQAQAGDRSAFEEYQRRIAQREAQHLWSRQASDQRVMAQLNALATKYPVLREGSHALTQYANQCYGALLNLGWPQGNATMLEAIKTAIADRPDLVAELYHSSQQAKGAAQHSATQHAQAGMTGAAHRQPTAPATSAPILVKPGEVELARRMGIKDVKLAKERFLKRQNDGLSSLGAVSAFVNESEF